ncbi:MAG TPA: ABC transporter permease [Vicinamibacterales bacterium]|jgi:ABC-type multidrug transport system permease subunit
MSSASGTSHPLVELTAARLREFAREPEAVFWVFVFPIVLAFALGIAFRTKADDPVYAGVVEGEQAARLAEVLRGTPGITVRIVRESRTDLALRDGEAQVIVIPGTPPTYKFDPTRPESRLARLVVDNALQRASGRTDRFSAREHRLNVIGARYIDWLIPGLLGMNIMGTSMWGIGFSIVQMRTRRVLRRLAATPMSRAHFLLAQVLARLMFLALEVGALLVFAWLMFGVPINGSWLTLAGVAVVGTLSFGGLSLLIASRPRTIESVSGWMNFAMLPMWILSGVFFSSANFPKPMQPIIHALPLTAVNDALRAVMLDGAPAASLAHEWMVMAGWGGLCFVVALKIFRWK